MKTANRLTAAVLAASLLLTSAAQATTNLPKPPEAEEQSFAAPEWADMTAGFELPGAEQTDLRLIKKRKRPQFQTRFFLE